MLDKWADIFGMMVIGSVAVTIVTNKNSPGTISAFMKGFAGDISAATAGAGK